MSSPANVAPDERSTAEAGADLRLWHAPVRLTRRGKLVCAMACVVIAATMLLLAHLTVSAQAMPTRSPSSVPATVVVKAGDTLWSIARAIAPDRDPRVIVAELRSRNHLVGVSIVPGQVLRTN